MSWRDPNWKYEPAATHGDPALFAQRQKMRAFACGQMLQQGDPRNGWQPIREPGVVYVWDVTEAPK